MTSHSINSPGSSDSRYLLPRPVRTNCSPSDFRQPSSFSILLRCLSIELDFQVGNTVLTWVLRSSRVALSRQNSRMLSNAGRPPVSPVRPFLLLAADNGTSLSVHACLDSSIFLGSVNVVISHVAIGSFPARWPWSRRRERTCIIPARILCEINPTGLVRMLSSGLTWWDEVRTIAVTVHPSVAA